QPAAVESVAADQVVLEGLGGADAELCPAFRLDAVADGNDHIQAVKSYGFVGVCNVHFLHIAFLLELALGKDITNVLGNDRSFTTEKINHLRLRQPYRLPGKPNIQGGLAVLGAVQDHFTAIA